MRPIPVDLKDGKARTIKLGAGALRRLELEVLNGRGLLNVLVDYLELEPPSYVISGVLWAGLLHAEPTLTIAETDKLLDEYVDAGDGERRIADLWVPIGEALLAAGVLRKAKEGEKPADPQEPATASSSPSPAGLN